MLLGRIAPSFPHTESNVAHARLLGVSKWCGATLTAQLPTTQRGSYEKLQLESPSHVDIIRAQAVLACGFARTTR